MERPRKDADAPDARTRIIEAFWELIENNSIFELSVGEVTRAAQCNRGTFYYYFHDFDELVAIAMTQLSSRTLLNASWPVSKSQEWSSLPSRGLSTTCQAIG